MIVATTPRLTLRRFTPDDAPFALALLNEPSFHANIGDKGVRTLDDARAYLESGPIASYATHGFGSYLVTRTSDGEALGMCGLLKRDVLDDFDIGYAFLPAHWSRGYALEAAEAVIAEGRETFGLTRVAGIVSPSNAASIRVLEKLGLRYERMVRVRPDADEVMLFARDL
jgi:[ribosomal protein S5]-alanine N-acetyltransferase